MLLDILQESEDIMSTRSRRCVVCYDKLQNVLLRPCRHMVYCTDCADKAKFHHVNCPTCRASIDETVIVHYS